MLRHKLGDFRYTRMITRYKSDPESVYHTWFVPNGDPANLVRLHPPVGLISQPKFHALTPRIVGIDAISGEKFAQPILKNLACPVDARFHRLRAAMADGCDLHIAHPLVSEQGHCCP